jgi:DNA-binding GntR family transcriptional regulator
MQSDVRPDSAPARSTRIDLAYTQLKSLIVSGRISPGTRIVETKVAERLGVSRTPVRSAVHRLYQEGYLHAQTGGTLTKLIVAPLTVDDARDLFEIVGGIEGIAGRRAAVLPAAQRTRITEDLREFDRALMALVRESTGPSAAAGAYEIFTQFHHRYVSTAGGERLIALHQSVKPQADRYRRLYSTALVDVVPASVAEHGRIIDAMEAGDPDATQLAIETNWRNAAERMADVIEALGERGSW